LNAVSAKAGVRSQAVIIPYAQAGVDVDKAEDIVLVESVLKEAMPLSFDKNGTSYRFPM
jgi:hypothetical protein